MNPSTGQAGQVVNNLVEARRKLKVKVQNAKLRNRLRLRRKAVPPDVERGGLGVVVLFGGVGDGEDWWFGFDGGHCFCDDNFVVEPL